MQPKHQVKISEIIPCSCKYNMKSVMYLKERLRALLDIHEENTRQLALIEEKQKLVKDSLHEKNIRLV